MDFLELCCVGVLAWEYRVCAYPGPNVGVCGVWVVFFPCFVVFSSFCYFFLLELVRAFLCPRRCMFCYGVPGPLYCGGLIGTL